MVEVVGKEGRVDFWVAIGVCLDRAETHAPVVANHSRYFCCITFRLCCCFRIGTSNGSGKGFRIEMWGWSLRVGEVFRAGTEGACGEGGFVVAPKCLIRSEFLAERVQWCTVNGESVD